MHRSGSHQVYQYLRTLRRSPRILFTCRYSITPTPFPFPIHSTPITCTSFTTCHPASCHHRSIALHPIQPAMKIDKYILCFDHANQLAAKRLQLHPATPVELQILITLKRLISASPASIRNYLRKHHNTGGEITVKRCLSRLLQDNLINKSSTSYSLSPIGREYLSHIRRNLLHKRL